MTQRATTMVDLPARADLPAHDAPRPDSTRPKPMVPRSAIAVGIPTSGRAALLSCVLDCIHRQTRAPDRVLICASSPADLPALGLNAANAAAVISPRGLTRQRNVLLAHSSDCDIMVFFDDDFLPHAR